MARIPELLDKLQAERQAIEQFDTQRPLKPGAMTPRQRIRALADEDSFFEIGGLSRSQQPDVEEVTPADGLIAGFAKVDGLEVGVLCEDPLAMARTDGQVAKAKRARIMELAAIRGRPLCLLVDGPDGHAPSFPQGTGRMFGHRARARVLPPVEEFTGPVVSLVFGLCKGDSASLAAASDSVLATRAAVEANAKPGARAALPVCDVVADTDFDVIEATKTFLRLVPKSPDGPLMPHQEFARAGATRPLTNDAGRAPSVLDALDGVLDRGASLDLQGGPGLKTGAGSVQGLPLVFVTAGEEGGHRLSAGDLAAMLRVARMARKLKLPLLIIQDCLGYDPNEVATAEFLRALADVQEELRRTQSPKICLVTGYGHVQAAFPLGGRELGTDYIASWPFAQVELDPASDQVATDGATDEQSGPWLAAGLGILDDVIAPDETRDRIAYILKLLAPARAYPTPEDDREGRLMHAGR